MNTYKQVRRKEDRKYNKENLKEIVIEMLPDISNYFVLFLFIMIYSVVVPLGCILVLDVLLNATISESDFSIFVTLSLGALFCIVFITFYEYYRPEINLKDKFLFFFYTVFSFGTVAYAFWSEYNPTVIYGLLACNILFTLIYPFKKMKPTHANHYLNGSLYGFRPKELKKLNDSLKMPKLVMNKAPFRLGKIGEDQWTQEEFTRFLSKIEDSHEISTIRTFVTNKLLEDLDSNSMEDLSEACSDTIEYLGDILYELKKETFKESSKEQKILEKSLTKKVTLEKYNEEFSRFKQMLDKEDLV